MAIYEEDNRAAGLNKPAGSRPISRLMTAVIQVQDYDKAVRALTQVGLKVTQLASTGGFLGRRNVTLLIGMEEDKEEIAVRTLSNSCRRRVEYVATPLEGAPFHLPLSTPVTVGGAIIFTLKIERYEEL